MVGPVSAGQYTNTVPDVQETHVHFFRLETKISRVQSAIRAAGAAPPANEMIEQKAGKSGLIVANNTVLLQKISRDVLQPHAIQLGVGRRDLFGALRAVTPNQTPRNRGAIDHDKIEYFPACMLVYRADMIGNRIVLRLAWLRHQIRDVNACGAGMRERIHHSFDQQIRNDACVERTGSHQHEVRFANCAENFRKWMNAARHKAYASDRLARLRDFRLTDDDRPVFELRFQRYVLLGRRENSSPNCQHLRRNSNRLWEIACNVRKRRQEEVAEAVASQSAPARKPILEKVGEQVLIFREGHHAVTNITGGQNAIFPTEAARTPTVVRHRNHGRKIGNRPLFFFRSSRRDMFLQAAQDSREPCAAAKRNYANRPEPLLRTIFHGECGSYPPEASRSG